jgi:hypothetical protein
LAGQVSARSRETLLDRIVWHIAVWSVFYVATGGKSKEMHPYHRQGGWFLVIPLVGGIKFLDKSMP